MTKPATLLLTPVSQEDIPFIQGVCIGVDRGAWFANEHNLPMVHLVGDFDSITPSQKAILIQKYPNQIMALPTQKDVSDAEAALRFALDQGYQPITILGGLGGRSDHFYALLNMLVQHAGIPIFLVHPKQTIQALIPGEYELSPTHDYFSLFPQGDVVVSLENADYPLHKKMLQSHDSLILSNEWKEGKTVTLTLHRGTMLLFLTND
jgi:thiamine pyrophosphokinase